MSQGHEIELQLHNLRVAYGDFVALEAEKLLTRGKIIAVIGHNGSGKSTLLKTILGLLNPRYGHAQVAGLHMGKKTVLLPEKHMAFSPENGAVFADITVESYIKLWCRIKQGSANYYRKGGSSYIEQLNIPPLMRKLGRELSKGQRRRVQIAAGFLSNPQLFLFDEPFDGMDIAQANRMAGIMLDESEKMSMIVSSHRMDVVERLADMIIVLRNGSILASGPLEEVCRQLCGKSIVISRVDGNGRELTDLREALKERFYSCIINQIGGQFVVVGNDISVESLESFLSQQRVRQAVLSQTRPSLVDAMHYHLRKLH